MKNVRKDVKERLFLGLKNAQAFAVAHNASYPKTFRYSTRRADHWIYQSDEKREFHYHTIQYDGSVCHSVESF